MDSIRLEEYHSALFGHRPKQRIHWLDILLLISAFGNVVLRMSPESDLTLFRLLLPVLVLRIVQIGSKTLVVNSLLFLVLFTLYVFLQFVVVEVDVDLVIAHYVHYAVLFLFIVYCISVVQVYDVQVLFKFAVNWLVLLLIIGYSEIAIEYDFINTQVREGVAHAWLWNENDYSNLLVVMMIVVHVGYKKTMLVSRSKMNVLLVLCACLVLVNSSRLSFLSIILYLVIFNNRVKLIGFFGLLGSMIFFQVFFTRIFSEISDYSLDIFNRILGLNEFSVYYGSDKFRVNSIINSIKSLLDTKMLGVGPGMTRTLASQHIGEVSGASIHNVFVQMFTELGLFFIAFAVSLHRMILKYYEKRRVVYGVISVLVISFSSLSGSVFTNYMSFFFVIYLFNFLRTKNS